MAKPRGTRPGASDKNSSQRAGTLSGVVVKAHFMVKRVAGSGAPSSCFGHRGGRTAITQRGLTYACLRSPQTWAASLVITLSPELSVPTRILAPMFDDSTHTVDSALDIFVLPDANDPPSGSRESLICQAVTLDVPP